MFTAPGGPYALLTERCLFSFDKESHRFRLRSVHPGHTVEEVRDNTGFDFDLPGRVPETPPPSPEVLRLIRGRIAGEVADTYPRFAQRVFGTEQPAEPAPPERR